MKVYILFIVWFILFTDINASDCEKEYRQFPTLLQDGWTLRINDKVEKFGCDIIPIYGYATQYNAIELLDMIDDNPETIPEIIKLFKNKQVLFLLAQNPNVKNIMIENTKNQIFLKNINYLFKRHLNYTLKQKIKNNPIYLNYFILSSANAKDREQADEIYKKLKKFSLDRLEAISFVLGAIGDKYKFEYLLENFITLKKQLSKKQFQQIIQYPEHLAYFLYPSKEDMDIEGSSKDIYTKQKEFQKLIISIYKNLYKYYKYKNIDQNIISLSTIQYLYPYIVQNQNYKELRGLFKHLIDNDFIDLLWKTAGGDICNHKKIEELFAVFGHGSLTNISRLKKDKNDLYHKLLKSQTPNKNLFLFVYVSNFYNDFSYKQWKIFEDMIYTLPSDVYHNIWVLKQLEGFGYFQNIIRYSDYKEYVKVNEDDINGKSTPKYKFIVFTSYPSDNDLSIYELIHRGYFSDAKNNLVSLYKSSIDELETHNFTQYEKAMAIVDTIDNTLTAGAFILAPFTGGVSLSYVAIKQSAKIGTKKGIKYYSKKLALKSRKLLNKSIYKARKFRKVIRKPLSNRYQNTTAEHMINRADELFSPLVIGATIGGALFFIPKNLEAKQICKEN